MTSTIVLVTASLFAADGKGLSITWEKNMLRIAGPEVPGGPIPINYLEAYCRSGSTNRKWGLTTIPHKTKLLSATTKKIRLRCTVEPSVTVEHEILAGPDAVTFHVTATNTGKSFVDVQWVQPCMRIAKFTGMKQDDYFKTLLPLHRARPDPAPQNPPRQKGPLHPRPGLRSQGRRSRRRQPPSP